MAPHDAGGGVRLEDLQDAPAVFERLFNDGDLEGFVSLYELDAVLVHEPGRQARGRAAIRAAVAELMRGNPTISIIRRGVQGSGGLVLALYDWTIVHLEQQGGAIDVAGRGVIVFRRQKDGAWLVVLDNLRACA